MLDKVHSTDVDKAVDKSVEKMNFVIRPIARARLAKSSRPPSIIAITVSDSIKISLETISVIAPADGRFVPWNRPNGEIAQISMRLDGERLMTTFKGTEGTRRNTFTLLDSGRTLAMDVLVESSRLPEPLRYRLRYTRVP